MNNFGKYFDHTLLKADATKAQIDALVEEAIEYSLASVCVNGRYVERCADKLKDTDIKVATVIGFPLGAMSMTSKVDETYNALDDGADEIDMVMNIGAAKDGDWDYVEGEISAIADACHSRLNKNGEDVILKVILETCLLTKDEIVKACQVAEAAGTDFVKTSTGFSTGGATVEDVKLMRESVGPDVSVKASGGIRTLEDANKFIAAGADRLGCSASVKIIKEL